ncbi:MAG: TAXI family TRAP transporter solute-binding subunit [Rickettsiaceae bacterium]|nr:TAXI family TRAP transporter solute-binding subunit [Rickettsiaceae bacterium]
MLRIYLIIICIIFSINQTVNANSNKINIKIGSGNILEEYYSIGLKVCEYLTKIDDNIHCEVEPTFGSIESLNLLRDGTIDFAFVQANLALEAYKAEGSFAKQEPFKGLRQVLRLHDEVFTVITRDDDKVLVFSDFDGKNISNGSKNSDSSVTYNELIEHFKFDNPPNDIEISHEKYANKLCNGEVDGIMMMTGHPNSLVSYIAYHCDTSFITIDSDKIDLLIKNNPAFEKTTLNKGFYPGITEDHETVKVAAIFVTNDKVNKELIKKLVKYIKNDEENFKLSHPVLSMLKEGHLTSAFILPRFDNINNK